MISKPTTTTTAVSGSNDAVSIDQWDEPGSQGPAGTEDGGVGGGTGVYCNIEVC